MWSFRALDRNISTQYYERRLAAQREKSALPVDMENSTDPLEYIKNPMMAEFMGFIVMLIITKAILKKL